MKLIYVAGPYRAKEIYLTQRNIYDAWETGIELVKLGVYPVIPHCNTANMGGAADSAFWLESTLELMRRCDGVFMMPGWQGSQGARGEHAEAERLEIPTFYSLEELESWLEEPGRLDWLDEQLNEYVD